MEVGPVGGRRINKFPNTARLRFGSSPGSLHCTFIGGQKIKFQMQSLRTETYMIIRDNSFLFSFKGTSLAATLLLLRPGSCTKQSLKVYNGAAFH
jgi:hypothetical protein